MPSIRPFRTDDESALSEVCLRTADAGTDASGILEDDELWALMYALPYARRHPDLCWVVEAEDGRVVGYLVATDDTEKFETWFRDEWWPRFAGRFARSAMPSTRQERLVDDAYARGPGRERHAREYPAHLHIDLLPEAQGQGLGRRLIDTLFAELRRRGVPGLHLGMDPANRGAAAFYERLGMQRLPSEAGLTYGIRLP